jgi:ribonuclease VapC
MIVSDTSAILAILYDEPDAPIFVDSLESKDVVLPASVIVEVGILATARDMKSDLDRLIEWMAAVIIPLDEVIAQKAVDAYERYGRGRHKANLNFGDCLVYATAKHLNLPLLYKGNDFVHTDLPSALS